MINGLVIEDGVWVLTFGRFKAVVPACFCDLPPCTCKRRKALDQWRGTHHQRYCHAGHPEHLALLLRRVRRRRRCPR